MGVEPNADKNLLSFRNQENAHVSRSKDKTTYPHRNNFLGSPQRDFILGELDTNKKNSFYGSQNNGHCLKVPPPKSYTHINA